MMKIFVPAAAVVFWAGFTAFGALDSIVNQQQFHITMGTNLNIQGPGGFGSASNGPIVVSLTQEGTANDGQTSAGQGISGVLTQTGTATTGGNGQLTSQSGITASGTAGPADQNPPLTDNGQANDNQNTFAGQTGSCVDMPIVLPSGSLLMPPSWLVTVPGQVSPQ